MHTIYTAVKDKEPLEAELETLAIRAGREGAPLAAAGIGKIVQVGIGPLGAEGITHRLALQGSRYVDVEHNWYLRHQPAAGKFYVRHADGTAECLKAEQVDERMHAPVAPGEVLRPATEMEIGMTQIIEKQAAEIADLKAKLAQTIAAAQSGPGDPAAENQAQSQALPSAADLDAVAAEQQVAEVTSSEGEDAALDAGMVHAAPSEPASEQSAN